MSISHKSNINKIIIGSAIGLNILGSLLLASSIFAHDDHKVTICHATSSTTNPYVRTVVDKHATAGHFDNNGTPLAGHEDDILFDGEVDCPNPSASPSPTSAPTGTPNPTPSATPDPTATPCGNCGQGDPDPTPTPAPTASPTPSPEASATPIPDNPATTSSGSTGGPASSNSSSSQPAQGGQVLGASALAPTGSAENLVTILFSLGIVLMTLSGLNYAQKKA